MVRRGIKSTQEIQSKNINFDMNTHLTDENLVRYCLSLIDFNKTDCVLDAGSGLNKVWFKNISTINKDEIEILDGKDFLKYNKHVDWVVGNPPYRYCWEFFEKAFSISNKGVGFLISINMFNKFTPKRMEEINKKGFYFKKLAIVSVKRWYGRYYFIIFTKEQNDIFVYSRESYN